MSLTLSPFLPPPGYSRVKVVKSFDELVTTRFAGGVNALCWERTLTGNFIEVFDRLSSGGDIYTVDEACLKGLDLSTAGRAAVDTLLEDQQRLCALGLSPVLECIHRYARDEDGGVVPTDVYSFHADSATVETD